MFLESKEAVGLEQWQDAFRVHLYNLELDNTKSKNKVPEIVVSLYRKS